MDLDDFRMMLGNSGVDIWGLIDTAIKVASLDYGDELRVKRDGIVEKLYTKNPNCDRSCNGFATNAVVEAVFGSEREIANKSVSPSTPVSIGGGGEEEEEGQEVEEEEEQDRRFVENEVEEDEDDELRRILSIKEQIEDPHQTDDFLVDLLQSLADMDITFKALKETDIGRHVNRLRKHPSSDVRRLVKVLVRKWKDLVDEWVRSNTPGEVQSSNNLIGSADDSPQQNVSKHHQNGNHNQVPDFAYSPNPHNGSFVSDKNNSEMEPKRKAPLPPPRRDPSAKPMKSASPASAPPFNRQKEVAVDPDMRLASATKRLQENYREAQNAKKQRTIQVMDIHEIPKPRNGFFGRNKGGFQRH